MPGFALRKPRPWARLLAGGLVFSVASAAHAELEGEPYAAAKWTHDSNLFRVKNADEAESLTGQRQLDDDLLTLTVGAGLRYTMGIQQVYGGYEWNRLQYQRNDALDHNEHRGVFGANWKLGTTLKGTLEASDTTHAESFADRDNADLSLWKQRRVESDNRYSFMPDWEFQLKLDDARTRYSLESSNNYALDEGGVRYGIAQAGAARLNFGLAHEIRWGDYPNRSASEGLTEKYRQQSLLVSAEYGREPSRWHLELGQTWRNNEGLDVSNFSGPTGKLTWEYAYSVKTRGTLELYREVESVEELDANEEVRSGLRVGAEWLPTVKISVRGHVELSKDDYQGGGSDADTGARKDHRRAASLALEYRPVFWLFITPSVEYDRRTSTEDDREFNDTMGMLEVKFRYD